jgi:hypothetical protein
MPWDSAKKCSVIVLSNSDRTASFDYDDGEEYASVANGAGRSTGKVYFEVSINQDNLFAEDYDLSIGVIKDLPPADWCGDVDAADLIVVNTYGTIINQGTTIEDYQGYAFAEVACTLCLAIDFTAGKMWFGINGSFYGNLNDADGDPETGAYPTITFTPGSVWYPVLNLSYLGA